MIKIDIFNFINIIILTQLTTGGKRDAEIATPINGPDAPSNNANATPEPDVNALSKRKTSVHFHLFHFLSYNISETRTFSLPCNTHPQWTCISTRNRESIKWK